MGFWGAEPKNNDGSYDIKNAADDYIASVASALYGKVYSPKRAIKTVQYCLKQAKLDNEIVRRFERAGATQLWLEEHIPLPRFVVEGAVADLDAVLASEWIKTFRSPRHAKNQVTFIRDAMQRLLTNEALSEKWRKAHPIYRHGRMIYTCRKWPTYQEVTNKSTYRKRGSWPHLISNKLTKFNRPRP